MPGNRCPNLTLEKLIRSVRRVQETCSDKAENSIINVQPQINSRSIQKIKETSKKSDPLDQISEALLGIAPYLTYIHSLGMISV